MIPADLLDQLRETDEELFLKVIGGFPLKNGKYLSILGMKPPAAHAWLQHCLQEAILWRGWGYHIRISRGHEIVSTIIGTGKRASDYFSEEGSTDAEAMLRAYLAAIHGEKA